MEKFADIHKQALDRAIREMNEKNGTPAGTDRYILRRGESDPLILPPINMVDAPPKTLAKQVADGRAQMQQIFDRAAEITREELTRLARQQAEWIVPVDAAQEKIVESQYFVWYPNPATTITIIWHGRYEVDDDGAMVAARERQIYDHELKGAMQFEQTIAPHPSALTGGEYYLYLALEAGMVVGYFYQLGPVCWNFGRPNPKTYGGWQAREGVLAQLLDRVLAEELHNPSIITPDAIPKIIAKVRKEPTPLNIDFCLPPSSGSRVWVPPAGTVHYQKARGAG